MTFVSRLAVQGQSGRPADGRRTLVAACWLSNVFRLETVKQAAGRLLGVPEAPRLADERQLGAGREANAQTTVWLICLNARRPTISLPFLSPRQRRHGRLNLEQLHEGEPNLDPDR